MAIAKNLPIEETYSDKSISSKLAFYTSACSLAVVYAASSAPIPLYTLYSQELGLASGDFSITAVAYFLGTIIALLVFARLSDYLGRKPVSFIAVLLAALGCLVFYHISGISTIFIGRLVQGLSCGLTSSAIAAYAVDTAPPSPNWLAAMISSGAPMIGLAGGAFGSGLIKESSWGSTTLVFTILLVMLIICAVLFIFCKETVAHNKGVLHSLIPRIYIPEAARKYLPAAACTFIGTWAIGGFYQAYSSTIAFQLLGINNSIMAAAVFASIMAPNLIGSFMVGRLNPIKAQRVGMLMFLLCIVALIIFLYITAAIPFLITSMLAGITWGASFTGAMRALLNNSHQQARASVLATIFFISYSGAVIPNLIVSQIAYRFSFLNLTIGYGLLVASTCILTLALTNRYKEL